MALRRSRLEVIAVHRLWGVVAADRAPCRKPRARHLVPSTVATIRVAHRVAEHDRQVRLNHVAVDLSNVAAFGLSHLGHAFRVLRIVVHEPFSTKPIYDLAPEICLELPDVVLSVQADGADELYIILVNPRRGEFLDEQGYCGPPMRGGVEAPLDPVREGDYHLGAGPRQLPDGRRPQRFSQGPPCDFYGVFERLWLAEGFARPHYQR